MPKQTWFQKTLDKMDSDVRSTIDRLIENSKGRYSISIGRTGGSVITSGVSKALDVTIGHPESSEVTLLTNNRVEALEVLGALSPYFTK